MSNDDRHGVDQIPWSERGIRKRPGRDHYTITYIWRGGKREETVPHEYRRETGRLETRKQLLTGFKAAVAMRTDREKQRHLVDWMPPRDAAKLASAESVEEQRRRKPLMFETARGRFMRNEAKHYADKGKAARTAFDRLGLFFNGRMLDSVQHADIRDFFEQRATGTGVYKAYTATKRGAEGDLSQLRALLTYLIECYPKAKLHATICRRPTSRKKGSPFAPARTMHAKITPGPATLAKIFTATKCGKTAANGAAGRELITDAHRAFFMLCYHTAARPESEPGRLRHRDIKFLADGWATVSYTDAKNAHSNRTIPVPPEVADALRRIMLEEPSRFEKGDRAAWAATYVFRKRGTAEHWDRWSYPKAWTAVRSVVPGTSNMWVRDLRATAKTWMAKTGIRSAVAMEFMGHKKRSVHDGYDNVDADDLRAAAEALRTDRLLAFVKLAK